MIVKEDYIHGGTQQDFYLPEETETCCCLLCESSEAAKIGSERGLSVVRCSGCGLIYTNPRPRNAEQNYFGNAEVFYNEARLIFKGKKIHHRDRNYEFELKKIKAVKQSGKLLDVGTNMGFFLRKAREFGYKTEGVEPSPALSQIAREQWGLNIHTAFLENAPLPEKDYDIITLIDVFEHVTQPKQILKRCHSLLQDDGLLVIKVPNGDYNAWKQTLATFTGKSSGMDIWDCCEHVAHYTPKTMRMMAESCGFRVKKFFIPLPIHSPVWATLVGHYFQYPSPFILDWKRILLRNVFYTIGRVEKIIGGKIRFGPDLMFFLEKKSDPNLC